MLSSEKLEREYVQAIYSRLATYQQKEHKPSSPRIWPRVRQFVDQQALGSVILDVGCGEAKYTSTKCHVIGFDTCAEVLSSSKKENIDLCLADAVSIPIRDGSVDAILNVAVIHHLATTPRRRQVLQECSRCLRVGGQILIYTWAFEQPNGKFASQDILVPWSMHETAIGGRLPKIKFHLNTTKEQRVIAASIPVTVSDVKVIPKWYDGISEMMKMKINYISNQLPYFVRRCPNSPGYSNHSTPTVSSPIQKLPSAAPQFLPTKTSLISGMKRWSPSLGKKLAGLLVPVEEQFAEEMAQTIMNESITEAMATLREVTFYRFYHVFKEGELADLVDSVENLKVVSTSLEHGNWCCIAEKIMADVIRP